MGDREHTFTDADRRKAVEVRQRKAAERKAAGRSLLEALASKAEEDRNREALAQSWIDQARGGDWKATEAIVHNLYGRPAQRVHITQGVDASELDEGQRLELRRVVLEQLRVSADGADTP